MYLETCSRFLSLLFAHKFLKTKGMIPKQWTETSTKISSSIDQVVCKARFWTIFVGFLT